MVETMESTDFWEMTPCNLIEVLRRFGGMYCLHHQGRRVSRSRKHQVESKLCLYEPKMEKVCFSETSLNCQTTQYHIRNDHTPNLFLFRIPHFDVISSVCLFKPSFHFCHIYCLLVLADSSSASDHLHVMSVRPMFKL
jgi:hypothetical protein